MTGCYLMAGRGDTCCVVQPLKVADLRTVGEGDDHAAVFAEVDGRMPVDAGPRPGDQMPGKPVRTEAHDGRQAAQPADAERAAASDRQPGQTVTDAARDLLAVANRFALKKFAIVGLGTDGPIALKLADLARGQATRLVIIGGPHQDMCMGTEHGRIDPISDDQRRRCEPRAH